MGALRLEGWRKVPLVLTFTCFRTGRGIGLTRIAASSRSTAATDVSMAGESFSIWSAPTLTGLGALGTNLGFLPEGVLGLLLVVGRPDGIKDRVALAVARPGLPQTRTCAINAFGSSSYPSTCGRNRRYPERFPLTRSQRRRRAKAHPTTGPGRRWYAICCGDCRAGFSPPPGKRYVGT